MAGNDIFWQVYMLVQPLNIYLSPFWLTHTAVREGVDDNIPQLLNADKNVPLPLIEISPKSGADVSCPQLLNISLKQSDPAEMMSKCSLFVFSELHP